MYGDDVQGSLPHSLFEKVIARARETASHSREYGVIFEALLEYYSPSVTIFKTSALQHRQHLINSPEALQALDYIKPLIRTDSTTLCEGHGSSGDPASLGIPALLLHQINIEDTYLRAVQAQLIHLAKTTPRFPNGAISHREASTSAWADFIYMVPPFYAYYGVLSNNENIVREAARQCQLYDDLLNTSSGLWRHTLTVGEHVPGERTEDDPELWSTSNGWAAMGMTRVVATIRNSQFNTRTEGEQWALIEIIERIVRGACQRDKDEFGLLRNYLDDETSWGEVAGTSLLAAAVLRMALIEPRTFYEGFTAWAVTKMNAVEDCINRRTGVVAPVANALNESQRLPLDGVSPEAQASVVLLQAAWRDWSLHVFGPPR